MGEHKKRIYLAAGIRGTIQIKIWKQGKDPEAGRSMGRKRQGALKPAGAEPMECIGIAGSGPSVGVTHFSLMTAAYAAGVLCRRTAVLEQNGSGALAQLESIWQAGKRKGKAVIAGDAEPFIIRGIFFYKKAERAEWYDCSEQGIEVAVIDFGTLTEKNQDAFFRCSRRFLVGSVSEWQLAAFAALAAEKQTWKKWCEYFVSFGEEEAVAMAEQYLDIRIRRIPLQKNALIVTGESMTFFGKFLR